MKNSINLFIKLIYFFVFLSIIVYNTGGRFDSLYSQIINQKSKIIAPEDRREAIHDGNQLRTVFYNYGSVGRPNWEPSIEWPIYSSHGYAYEIGLMIGAEVVNIQGDTIHIFSDALIDGGDLAPGGKVWGWQPLAQYQNPSSHTLAISNDQNSWPVAWPFWLGLLGSGIISADLESYWVMDDRDNDEFDYYPFPSDSSLRGLGIEVTCRGYQWNNATHEDFLIYHYTIKNVSNKRLDKVVVGMFGDPHIGGPGDFSDDYVDFDSIINMVYSWDAMGSGNDYGISWVDLGWLGIKILETPSDSNGNDLGLTSMSGPLYGFPTRDDEQLWQTLTPGNFGNISQNVDNVIIMGSGYFSLDPGEEKIYSVSINLGRGLNDLLFNAANSQVAYSSLQLVNPHNVTINNPVFDEEISGNYEIHWTASSGTGNPLTIDVYYNLNAGDSWFPLVQDIPNSGSYWWDTGLVPDGYNYQLNIIADDGQIFGNALGDYFKVNNPQNFVNPEIILLYPTNETILAGNVDIQWRAGDADGDSVTINIYCSNDHGNTWEALSLNENNDGSYLWNTATFPNGTEYQLKLAVTNGILEIESLPSSVFSISNDFPIIPDTSIFHVQGNGDGNVEVTIIDPSATTGHYYQLTFDDSSDMNTTYDVFNIDANVYVVENATQISSNLAGPLFDGLRLEIDDIDKVIPDEDSSGWTSGNCNLELNISLFSIGIRIPVDYKITFYDMFVDTSVLVNPKPIKFQVWNIIDSVQIDVIFIDNNNNDTVNVGDQIVPIYYDNGTPKGTWQVAFLQPSSGNSVLPTLGDELSIFTLKPFTFRDVFEFQSPLPAGVRDKHSTLFPAKFNLFQNFPNPFNNSTRIQYQLPKTSQVTLTIFDIMGKKVNQLVNKEHIAGKYSIIWNGNNLNNKPVASGLYFYSIIAGEYSKVKKCLIIK